MVGERDPYPSICNRQHRHALTGRGDGASSYCGLVDDTADPVALVERAVGAVGTADESRWFDELDAERDSVDALVSSALAAGDGAAIAHLAALLWPYWTRRATDGADWLERSVACVERVLTQASGELASLLYGAGLAAFRRGDNARCRDLSQRSLDAAIEARSARAEALAHVGLSRVAFRDRDWTGGLEHARSAGRIAAESDDEAAALMALHMEAEINRASGEYAEAVTLYERLLEGDRAAGDTRAAGMELYNLGSVLVQIGELDRAETCLRESLAVASGHDPAQIAYTTLGLAGLAAQRGDPAIAGQLLGSVEAYFEAVGEVLDPAEQLELQSHRVAAKSAGQAAFESAYLDGRSIAPRDAAALYLDTRAT